MIHPGPVAGDLPLDDEVGSYQAARRIVEQPVQDRGGPGERRIRHDAVGRAGQWHVTHVGVQHDDVRRGGEPSRQPMASDASSSMARTDAASGQRRGQHARARAEVDDPIATVYSGVGNEQGRELLTTEKVLTEPARPIGRRAPGHGTP